MYGPITKNTPSLSKFNIACLVISSLLSITIITSSAFMEVFSNPHQQIIQIINTFGITYALVFSIYLLALNAISNMQGLNLVALTVISLMIGDLSIFSMENYFLDENINQNITHFTLYSIFTACYTFTLSFFMNDLTRIAPQKSRFISLILTLPIGVIYTVAIMSSQITDLTNFKNIMFYYRESVPLTYPLLVVFIAFTQSLHHSKNQGFFNRFTHQLRFLTSSNAERHIVLLISSLSAISIVLYQQIYDSTSVLISFSSFSWIAIAVYHNATLKKHYQNSESTWMSALISNHHASHYLRRHFKHKAHWAFTTGVRTANFTINHSPTKEDTNIAIPASIQQIRNHIIQDSIVKMLEKLHLNYSFTENKITGSLDPEKTTRSCVESIMLFTCLYIDGIPLLERRIKTLSNILPILDNGLDKVLDDKLVNHLLSSNTWLFHLDYCWVDQYLIYTRNHASYHYDAKGQKEEYEHDILQEMKRKGLLGNYIWLSHDAKTQLNHESPHLSKIVIPLEINNLPSNTSTVVFLLKFEDLIPRLQRYYLLDQRRIELKDLPQDSDSRRISNLIELQLSQELDLQQSEDILKNIQSFAWTGYKSKDIALNLTLKLYKKTMKYIDNKIFEEERRQELEKNFRRKFVRTIENIGYPSQALHLAQVEKHILRSNNSLIQIASDPTHSSFFDAWIYIANEKSSDESTLPDILSFIEKAPGKNWGNHYKFVRSYIISTLGRLPQHFITQHHDRIAKLINTIYQWTLRDMDINDLYWLMDTHLYMQQKSDATLDLNHEVTLLLKNLEKLETDPGTPQETMKLAFTSRLIKIESRDEHSNTQKTA